MYFKKVSKKVRVEYSGFSNVIFSIDEFKAVISYERSRCDRENTSFSVILFESDRFEQFKHSDFVKCIKGLKNLVRGIDHIGWWAENTIAILLPSTSEEGASICAQKIQKFLETQKIYVPVKVYCYPHNWLDEYFCEDEPEKKTCKDDELSFERVFIRKVPVWKRIVDIIGSVTGIIILSPLFLIIALYIKVVSPGKVFFKQRRVGFRGKEFNFLKYRSMHEGTNEAFHGKHATKFIQNADTPMKKLDEVDPRIIPGGKMIRKLCIDELPQLFNVLKGEMSLVGPRPCIPYEKDSYLQWHTHRFDVLPGMTGIWQVSGKNKLTFKQMIRLDIAYCRNLSLFLDLKIILLTIPAIIKIVIESRINKVSNRTNDVGSYNDYQNAQTRSS